MMVPCQNEIELESNSDTKLAIAKSCLLALLSQLREGDAFGLVVFNQQAAVVHPLTKCSQMNRVDIEKAIVKLRANGGTALSEGLFA